MALKLVHMHSCLVKPFAQKSQTKFKSHLLLITNVWPHMYHSSAVMPIKSKKVMYIQAATFNCYMFFTQLIHCLTEGQLVIRLVF